MSPVSEYYGGDTRDRLSMKCETWLDDNPEATPSVQYTNNIDFESSVQKYKEELEAAQLMVADEQKLN